MFQRHGDCCSNLLLRRRTDKARGREAPAEEDVRQFAWWNGHHDEQTGEWTFALVDEAVEFLADFVRKEGPFDGVFGFSQGGMTASMLLQRQCTPAA